MSVARDRPMQETAIADGEGERLSLEGDPVALGPGFTAGVDVDLVA